MGTVEVVLSIEQTAADLAAAAAAAAEAASVAAAAAAAAADATIAAAIDRGGGRFSPGGGGGGGGGGSGSGSGGDGSSRGDNSGHAAVVDKHRSPDGDVPENLVLQISAILPGVKGKTIRDVLKASVCTIDYSR